MLRFMRQPHLLKADLVAPYFFNWRAHLSSQGGLVDPRCPSQDMQIYNARKLAAAAVAARPDRPSTAVVHDTADVRLVVFRIQPGQQVATHTNASTVVLTVVEGTGVVTGTEGERAVGAGDVIAFAPREPHGMRSIDEDFILVAAIIPRSGDR
jgi:quercetin dioxygenase-like cupin family protein